MTDERFAELLALWLAGGLVPAEEAELLAAVRADAERRNLLLEEHRLHLALRSESAEAEADPCIERIRAVLRQESTSGTLRTIDAVARRVGIQGRAADGSGRKPRTSRRLAQRRPGARIGWWLAAAALLAVLTGAWWIGHGDGRMATIVAISGGVGGERAARPSAWTVGDAVGAGDRLSTAPDGMLSLRFADGTAIELAADSRLHVDRDAGDGGTRLRLDAGRLDAQVAHQQAGRRLRVTTPMAEAEVVGTRLRVLVDAERTRLEVSEGRVRFTDRSVGSAVEVGAGGYAEARSPAERLILGETRIAAEDDWQNGNTLCAQPVVLGRAATIQSLSFYVTIAAGTLQFAIYDASGPGAGPGVLRAATARFTPLGGWNTQAVERPASLAAGTYWLSYLPSSDRLHFRRGPGGSCRFVACPGRATPGIFPTTGLTTHDTHWSLYATLTATGPAEPSTD